MAIVAGKPDKTGKLSMPGLTGKAKKKQSITMPYKEDTALFIGLIFVLVDCSRIAKRCSKGIGGAATNKRNRICPTNALLAAICYSLEV